MEIRTAQQLPSPRQRQSETEPTRDRTLSRAMRMHNITPLPVHPYHQWAFLFLHSKIPINQTVTPLECLARSHPLRLVMRSPTAHDLTGIAVGG
ncbi:MAG TPA: hypothetical protein VMW10_09395 [Alphaproteobacteria bacterium]|nr:hypothetical protein [Alphaproteobacteria bacterium]